MSRKKRSLFSVRTAVLIMILVLSLFSTVAWGTPAVLSWSPVSSGSTSTHVTATFSEAMDQSSISNGSFTLSRFVGIKSLAAGEWHNLALKNDGTVVAWGGNSYGESTLPSDLSGVVTLAAGLNHSIALKSDGTVKAWGANDYGQINLPVGLKDVKSISAGPYSTVVLKNNGTVEVLGGSQADVPPVLSGVTAIASGSYHHLALKLDGTVVSWGKYSTIPSVLSGVKAIAASGYYSLALKNDGTAVVWGENFDGMFMAPTVIPGVIAIAHGIALKDDGTVILLDDQLGIPAGLTGVTSIAAGERHYLATKSDGTVVVWGEQRMLMDRLPGVSSVSAGGHFNLVLTNDGNVDAWGYDYSGQSEVPTGFSGVKAIAAGWDHGIALKGDGTVVAWGGDASGQATVPTGLSGVQAIAAGNHLSLALKGDGTVVSWGDNASGQGTVPIGLSGVQAIAAGDAHSLALKGDGTVVAWGANNWGQATVPTGLSGVKAIAAGNRTSLALKNDGTVVAWGENSLGDLTVPTDLAGVVAIAAGGYHQLALKEDGTVVAWGDNYYGQTDVPKGLSGVIAIAAGYLHSLALKRDGTVVAWGDSSAGQGTAPFPVSESFVNGTVTYDPVTYTATMTPTDVLLSETNYEAWVTTGIRAQSGEHIPTDVVWNFKTELLIVSGVCGTANGQTLISAPSSDLCSSGTASVVTGTGPWYWTCNGSNGGANQNCSANAKTYTVTFSAATGGSINGNATQMVQHGGAATAVMASSAAGMHFVNWTGTNGFTTTTTNPLIVANVTTDQSITANFAHDPVNGVCGASNGKSFVSAPATNLCATGTPTVISGSGPWSWECKGEFEGVTATCFAEEIIPITINSGSLYASSPAVTIGIVAPSGLGYVRLSNDGIKWSKWQAVVSSLPWKLSTGDGQKTVTAQFAASSTATTGENYSATIFLDTKAPAGTVQLNGGAKLTKSTTVSVGVILKSPDTVDTMSGICINEDALEVCSNFKQYVLPLDYTLTVPGDGKKTIFVTLKDKSGKVSKPLKASIFLDTVAPDGTVLINGGKTVTLTPLVALKLVAKGAVEMQISLDGGTTWRAWQKFAGSTKETLPEGKGIKTVKARFRDQAGNISAECESRIELQ